MKKLQEYSKGVIDKMIVLWFIGAVFGMLVVAVEIIISAITMSYSSTVHLPELLAYIGAPVSGGILAYLLKSAFENREKIRRNPNQTPQNDARQDADIEEYSL